jgi:hypothetical protein
MSAERLADLRLDLIAGERLRTALEPVCHTSAVPGAGPADLLLVESGAGVPQEEIVHAVESASSPAALWLTRHADVHGFPPDLLARFDAVFVTDALAQGVVSQRMSRPPLILPHPVSAGALAAAAGGSRIGYAGGFSEEWPAGSRALAEALLEAALPHGLDVLDGQGDDLPERFRGAVRESAGGVEGLQACRAVIVFVPAGQVPSVPAIALDALAMGVLVIMRSSDAWQLLPPRLVAYVPRPAQAAERVAWCMDRGDAQLRRSDAGRAAARNAHTAAARLATLASAFGMTLLADAAGV